MFDLGGKSEEKRGRRKAIGGGVAKKRGGLQPLALKIGEFTGMREAFEDPVDGFEQIAAIFVDGNGVRFGFAESLGDFIRARDAVHHVLGGGAVCDDVMNLARIHRKDDLVVIGESRKATFGGILRQRGTGGHRDDGFVRGGGVFGQNDFVGVVIGFGEGNSFGALGGHGKSGDDKIAIIIFKASNTGFCRDHFPRDVEIFFVVDAQFAIDQASKRDVEAGQAAFVQIAKWRDIGAHTDAQNLRAEDLCKPRTGCGRFVGFGIDVVKRDDFGF